MTVSEGAPLQQRVDDLEAEVQALDSLRTSQRQAIRAEREAHLAALRQDLRNISDFNMALRTQLRVRQQKSLRFRPAGWRAGLDRGLLLGLWLGASIGCALAMGPAAGVAALAVWPVTSTVIRRLSGRNS